MLRVFGAVTVILLLCTRIMPNLALPKNRFRTFLKKKTRAKLGPEAELAQPGEGRELFHPTDLGILHP